MRPTDLSTYIGQPHIKDPLHDLITSAKSRKVAIDHILMHGFPGGGKTSIAQVVANEMSARFKSVNAAALADKKDLLSLILDLQDGDVLFIDEIHRLPIRVAELLYTAMEDHKVDVTFGTLFPSTYTLNMPDFTLIGATTLLAKVAEPLRARFGSVFSLQYYSDSDLYRIIDNLPESTGFDPDAKLEIAKRGRGTPRITITLVKRVRDYAVARGQSVNQSVADSALNGLGIDVLGLNADDRKYLTVLHDRFGGNPAGVEAIASVMNTETDTVDSVIEPWLLKCGLIDRTPKGRVLTVAAYLHMDWPITESPSMTSFM